MGADFYDFDALLGIEIPLKKVNALHKRLGDESVFKVHVYEPSVHSRMETLGLGERVEGCFGFLGIVERKFQADEVISLRHEFAEFLRSNQRVLKELGIEATEVIVRAGLPHPVEEYLEIASDSDSD